MNIGELKAKLADLPDDVEVVLSKDGEGNAYRPLDSTSLGPVILNKRPGSDLVADVELLDDEEYCQPDCDGMVHRPDPCEPLPDDAVPGIVLWPNY